MDALEFIAIHLVVAELDPLPDELHSRVFRRGGFESGDQALDPLRRYSEITDFRCYYNSDRFGIPKRRAVDGM